MLYFLWGCSCLIIGILDLRFDYDNFTYLWLIAALVFVIVGYLTKKPKK